MRKKIYNKDGQTWREIDENGALCGLGVIVGKDNENDRTALLSSFYPVWIVKHRGSAEIMRCEKILVGARNREEAESYQLFGGKDWGHGGVESCVKHPTLKSKEIGVITF